jgi:hypothetical protein
MKLHEDRTIQAFTLALPQLNGEVSPELHQQIQKIGQDLSQGQPGVAAAIDALIQNNPVLKQPFEQAYDQLAQKYRSQERTKGLTNSSPTAAALTWEDVAVPVLLAGDFRTAAEQALQRMNGQLRKMPAEAQPFLSSLQTRLRSLEVQERDVLSLLYQQPLTLIDLVHRLRISREQAEQIVKSLWQKGFIDWAESGVWSKLFPDVQSRQSQTLNINPDASLTLTVKGHFYLHPVFNFGFSRAAV